jgi:hypothetical protein
MVVFNSQTPPTHGVSWFFFHVALATIEFSRR